MLETATRKRSLTRREASEYLIANWFPVSRNTLAKLATIGGGPIFSKAGRVPLYAEEDLDQYAREKIGPRVSSTSELATRVA
jgi:hypothetical protein